MIISQISFRSLVISKCININIIDHLFNEQRCFRSQTSFLSQKKNKNAKMSLNVCLKLFIFHFIEIHLFSPPFLLLNNGIKQGYFTFWHREGLYLIGPYCIKLKLQLPSEVMIFFCVLEDI